MKRLPTVLCLMILACSKQAEPNCMELLYVATDGQNTYTTNFGKVCGGELEYYKSVAGRVELICPPNTYGQLILKRYNL